MRPALFILLSILTLELILGATYLHQRERPLPTPELRSVLFRFVPPEPAKTLKETLAYQTAPLSYPSQGMPLTVEGDMILAHINKTFTLPSWYVPPGLVDLTGQVKTIGPETVRRTVLLHLKDLLTAAEKACGCNLAVLSAYRSYQTQVLVYNYWVSQLGQYYADLCSARPGHSEHQLGTTIDFTSSTVGYELTRDFGYTEEGIWLANNAHKYGFVLSYPKGKDGITDYIRQDEDLSRTYIWEPWHFRWVGKEVAKEIYRKGITLEDYLSSR